MEDSNKIFDKSETQGKMFTIGLQQKLGSSVQGGRALRVAYAVCPRPGGHIMAGSERLFADLV